MINIISILYLNLLLFNFYVLMFAFTVTKRRKICHICLGLILISFIRLHSLGMDLSLMKNNNPIFVITQIFQSIPADIYIIIFLIMLAVSVYLTYIEHQYRQNTITRTSIKESIDNLPAGLCFSTVSGIVFLSNKTMNNLCHKITGRDLQDAEAFWQEITESGQNMNMYKSGNQLISQFDNKQTWSFSRHNIKVNNKAGVQITAVNITELDELRTLLKKKNTEFMKMNTRLRQYSENLAAIKSKEERLATKTQLHSELGYILLATRRIMANKEFDQEGKSVLALWKQNIAALLSGNGMKEKNAFEELLQSAADIGIKLQLHGELPQKSKIKDIVMISAIEALNNAIRHADATVLNLTIEETEKEYTIELTNDGALPEKKITEGGGLSALREKIRREGGIMGIDTVPVFKLWIRLPKNLSIPIQHRYFK